jgi:hypothetical protein
MGADVGIEPGLDCFWPILLQKSAGSVGLVAGGGFFGTPRVRPRAAPATHITVRSGGCTDPRWTSKHFCVPLETLLKASSRPARQKAADAVPSSVAVLWHPYQVAARNDHVAARPDHIDAIRLELGLIPHFTDRHHSRPRQDLREITRMAGRIVRHHHL